MRALVFSGGGAKGSYQIGVWKALRRLHKKIDIVTGTSIGSINACMFSLKKYYKAKRFWLKVKTNDLFDYDTNKKIIENKKNIKKFINNKGFSTDKINNILYDLIDEEKLRKSKIKYGLVTYNLKTKSPKELSIDDIPRGKLIDYVIASSTCFPVISKKEINGDYYIDGGYYDNMPINLAINMGADEVIAIDLSVLAFNKKVNNKTVDVNIIKCGDKKLFTLDFSYENARRLIKLGYNDTLKHFNKLDGNNYTFKKNDLLKNYNFIFDYYVDLLNSILLTKHNNAILNQIFKISRYNKIFTNIKQNKSINDIINSSLEYLGNILDIDNSKIYSINKYNKLLIKKIKEYEYIKIGKNLKGKMLIGYIYNKYMNCEDKNKVIKELFNIALIFPKEFLAIVYLLSISKKYPLTLKDKNYYLNLYKNLYKKDL